MSRGTLRKTGNTDCATLDGVNEPFLIPRPLVTRRRCLLLLTAGVAFALPGCSKRTEQGSTRRLPEPHRDGDPLWAPEAKAYLISVPVAAQREGDRTYPGWLRGKSSAGIVALRAACPNDAVAVSWCRGERFFSCPGCGSTFTRYGDYVDGPSPRGLDRFEISLTDTNEVIIDRAVISPGPPRGVTIGPLVDPGTFCDEVQPD